MTEIIKKRRSISVKEKLAILSMVEGGEKLVKVARAFGISTSTASSIVKERFKIKLLAEHYRMSPNRKRMRLGLFKDIDEAVNIWVQQMRAKNSPLNGPMLQQKAKEFATQLGHKTFEPSTGWLFRFRERFGLTQKSIKEDDRSNIVTGVGMTDDEIVASVCPVNIPSERFLDTNVSIESYEPRACEIYEPRECESYEPREVIPLEVKPAVTFPEAAISFPEAIQSVEKLIMFLRDQEDVPDHIWTSLNTIEGYILLDLPEKYKQKKITDYFRP